MTRTLLSSTALLALACTSPAAAQTIPDPAATATPAPAGAADDQPTEQNPTAGVDEDDAAEITVVARRDPTAVIGDIPPENTLSSRDIRAYGATSVSELLDALAPQLGSARGRGAGQPVVLLNGRRISGFREIRDLPPEAILRLDILPEEVALKYGYRADQRVVNIVLRPRFRSTSVRAEAGLPTGGGSSNQEGDITRLLIGENTRTTLNAHAENSSGLTEDERDISFAGSGPDPRPFRSLTGEQRLVRVGGTHNRPIGSMSATIDGQVEKSSRDNLLGPSLLVPGTALDRNADTLSGHLGIAVNGNLDQWRWSLTGGYDIARTQTDTDRENDVPVGFADRARLLSQTGNLELVANGSLFRLPAGRSAVTLRAGAYTQSLDSKAIREGVPTSSDLDRQRGTAAINLDLPISRRRSSFDALGNLTLNANAEVEQLSDFGTLTTLGGGLNWSPVERLQLIASWTREEGPPTLNQLGDPVLITPGSRIFDFTRGDTALVDAVSGGNPLLDADTRRVMKLGLTWRPLSETDLNLRADLVRTRTDNPISSFPGVTEAIEAAFPDRFVRNGAGDLVRVDLRPVNFDQSSRTELRWGFNFSKPLQSRRPPASVIQEFRRRFGVAPGGAGRGGPAGGAPTAGAPRVEGGPSPGDGRGVGPGGRGGGGGRGGRGGFGQGGRLQLSLYHTWVFRDQVRIAPGLPTIDYLSGDAVEGGFRPRHRLEAEAGYFNNGLGARLSADWRSGGSVQGGTGDLDFNSLTRFNLNLFANLGDRWELALKHPWLRGTQVRLQVSNLFDARQRVRTLAGEVPLNYQSDLLDPQGRTVSISLRKLFLPPPTFFRRNQQGSGQR
ncbi:TonB-dependent receptor [Sphingomonas sp. BN140010]|uniref:TonB-dependent receptor n=1 Tax=Sphingomonas arvum TaxID=2992113 RepID=A0ABT3JEB9_9SPHN|nr:TonB-dependent receptor [Sphingomonas sp. BN140010]MCW3797413.1 TonB-dependent receptor [Sphingomonas sp. BN140010]